MSTAATILLHTCIAGGQVLDIIEISEEAGRVEIPDKIAATFAEYPILGRKVAVRIDKDCCRQPVAAIIQFRTVDSPAVAEPAGSQ